MKEDSGSALASPPVEDEWDGFGDEWDGFDFNLERGSVVEPPEKDSESPEAPKTAPEAPTEPDEASGAAEASKAPQSASQAPEKAPEGPTLKKRARKPLSKREKAVRVMLRRAELDALPPLEQLMRCKSGQKMAIRDIGLFVGEPADACLKEIAEKCPIPNRVNLSAEVTRSRVITVGADILKKGRMFQPIQVARIEEDGALECTSGRHRLAFLAMAYGPGVEIPVYIESMTLNEARDAVVVANQARPTKALERAEHAVMKAVGGNTQAKQDELYAMTVTTKAKAKKYCVYSVIDRGYPVPLDFSVSLTSSRKDGSLTTLTNVENFWGTALEWKHGMSRADFDESLGASITFLNKLVASMKVEGYFNPVHHLAAMTMSAIGKYYRSYQEITGKNAIDVVDRIAEEIVAMGDIGRQKSDETYNKLTQAMRG